MKKALTLILSLMLCLCLCACGGMPGEEAALLYPDIIGEWGTDPFGEEFVLTLFKDGSCSILGTDGTWTLDDKRSNEEWVELTVKTEAMKYYVELDRVQDGMESVHLWITDTKKETTVYEGSVFTPGTQYVFPEIALHAVPELVGEWGTPYWNEESILTINEDGTCTLLRQPGRWCLESFAAVWPKIIVHIKLDSGIQYRVPITWLDGDWGYAWVDIMIKNLAENTYIFSNPETEYPVFRSVNRPQLVQPMDVASIVVGEWTEGEDKQPFAKFNEDGTCTIRGAEGLWTLDYTAYYNEKYRNGWDYCLHAKISGDEYDICFSDHGSGQYTMYIVNQDDGIYILNASEVFKINAG